MTSLSLLGTKLEVLSPFQSQMLLGLARFALQTKNNLTCGLGLLVEDGLSLTTETHLLGVVTTLSLGEVGGLTSFVLGHLVNLVLTALLAGAESLTFLRYINHFDMHCIA